MWCVSKIWQKNGVFNIFRIFLAVYGLIEMYLGSGISCFVLVPRIQKSCQSACNLVMKNPEILMLVIVSGTFMSQSVGQSDNLTIGMVMHDNPFVISRTTFV